MKKQEETIIVRVDDDLKSQFTQKAQQTQMKVGTRIKYLMKMDVEGKLTITNG
jgi:antitoxin component of RelBE/YafQ-DinJ toxin-antitoxin module